MTRLGHIVLVHGAWHSADCWQYLVPLLEKEGYRVSVPDLPGHGNDKTPPKDVTLQSYIDRVVGAVTDGSEPVLLLGHSLGGAVVCGVAEAVPEKIGRLVILSSAMAEDGHRLGDQLHDLATANPDLAAAVMPNRTVEGALDFDTRYAARIFYNTCTPEMVASAIPRLVPQPATPFDARFRLSPARFGKVPKTYIFCLQDNGFPVAVQRSIAARYPGIEVREIDTDHSPFFSQPEELAAMIDAEARG